MPILTARDVTLYYETAGSGVPLLLLHGLGSSSQDWQLQVEAFAPHYQVITLDVRGHGRSSKPPGPYTIPQFAADLNAFVQALGVAPVHLLGLSLGGMIALQTAVDYPHLLRSLIIVNSYPELTPRTWRERWAWQQRVLIVRLFGMARLGQYLSRRLFPLPEQAELRQIMVARWAQNELRPYLAAMQAVRGWSVSARLGEIRCPTLVIAADQDYTSVASKEAYTAKIPGARLHVIANSRHATPIDQPQAFNCAVLAFLSNLQRISDCGHGVTI